MKIHQSHYEKQGWISVNDALPKEREMVRICSINILDWNMEEMKWEARGSYKMYYNKPIWTIKAKFNPLNSPVTHWKKDEL